MESKNSIFTIVFAVVVTAIVVGGGMLIWQNKSANTITSPATLNSGSGKSPDEGSKLSQNTQIACAENLVSYDAQNFSFCYKVAWGAPKITDESHPDGTGKLFHLTFANDEYRNNDHSTPDIWWESEDFSPGSAQDYSLTCFTCIDFSKSEAEIIKALDLQNKNATIQKTSIDGKNALRIHRDYFEKMFEQGNINQLKYLIPNAFAHYHFQVSIINNKAEDLDTFMKSISFH